jgi:hypothetical protein
MTIHLINSVELSPEVFTAVNDSLTAVDGIITIKCVSPRGINSDQREIFKRFYEAEQVISKMTALSLYSVNKAKSRRLFSSYFRIAGFPAGEHVKCPEI